MNWNTVQRNWKEFKMKVRAERPEVSDGRFDVLADNGDGLAAERQALCAGTRNAAEEKVRLVCWPTTKVVAVEAEEEFPPNNSTSWQ